MKASQFLITTLKEAPADAEVVSHQLMTRAGMIKKLGAGIYSYMPMGLRVIQKVEAIVREEMNRAGAVEMTMPVVQPAELWQETGRFEKMGPELLRIKDRHDRDYIVQPTSEEVVTDVARQELRSYKQLPKNLYQIQTKFRDERRPRFGLMRGREFIMKDAYSFDRDEASAKASYQVMAAAYRRIFDRFGLTYRAVAADSGAIGGDLSEEFQVIAATGEDARLQRDLRRKPVVRPAADARVLALRVLAHDVEVDLVRRAVGERRAHAGQQPAGAQVHILVEAAADRDEQAPERDVVRHPRPADGAEEDRIVPADALFPVLRHHAAVLEVVVAGREVEPVELQREAVPLGDLLEDADALRHHLLADAVARDDCHPIGPCHDCLRRPRAACLVRCWNGRS